MLVYRKDMYVDDVSDSWFLFSFTKLPSGKLSEECETVHPQEGVLRGIAEFGACSIDAGPM